ncbi:MAG: hypothetical protein HY459_02030 [Parcubacteria group bacterium]|nr:hypothetical protein [Parcubacteria group bacterium]
MADTKWERRDRKQSKRKKMGMDGSSTRLLQEIIWKKGKVRVHKPELYPKG